MIASEPQIVGVNF